MQQETTQAASPSPSPCPSSHTRKKRRHVDKEVIMMFRKQLHLLRQKVQQPLFFCSDPLDDETSAEQFAQQYVLHKLRQSKHFRREKKKRRQSN